MLLIKGWGFKPHLCWAHEPQGHSVMAESTTSKQDGIFEKEKVVQCAVLGMWKNKGGFLNHVAAILILVLGYLLTLRFL